MQRMTGTLQAIAALIASAAPFIAVYIAGIATGIAALLIISAHLTPSNGHDAAAKAKRAARK
jgi:hypothetical protein